MEEKKKNKKIYIIIIAIFVLLLGFNFFSYFKTALLLSDRYIPVVYGKNPVNNKSDYIDLSKGVIILSGWGTWCVPSWHEASVRRSAGGCRAGA